MKLIRTTEAYKSLFSLPEDKRFRYREDDYMLIWGKYCNHYMRLL